MTQIIRQYCPECDKTFMPGVTPCTHIDPIYGIDPALPTTRPMTIRIDEDLHKRLKVVAAKSERSMQDIVVDAIKKEVDDRESSLL